MIAPTPTTAHRMREILARHCAGPDEGRQWVWNAIMRSEHYHAIDRTAALAAMIEARNTALEEAAAKTESDYLDCCGCRNAATIRALKASP